MFRHERLPGRDAIMIFARDCRKGENFSVIPGMNWSKRTKRRDVHFMKSTKQLFLTVLTLAALHAGAWAQTSDSTSPPPTKKHKPAAAAPAITAADVQALQDAIAAQQQQIQQLTQQLQQLQQNWRKDWPAKKELQELIIRSAQLTPILERLVSLISLHRPRQFIQFYSILFYHYYHVFFLSFQQ